MKDNNILNKLCNECNENQISYILRNRSDNNTLLLCEDCKDKIQNEEEYEIVKIKDVQKEKLIDECKEINERLKRKMKILEKSQIDKCNDYINILNGNINKIITDIFSSIIQNKANMINENLENKNFLINKNYEIIINRIQDYKNKLETLQMNEEFQNKIYKQSIEENLNIINRYIDDFDDILKNYKKTNIEDFLKLDIDHLYKSIDKYLDESLKNIDLIISGTYIECEQIVKTAYKQVCTNLDYTREIVNTKYFKYFDNINEFKLSPQNFSEFNNSVKQYIQKTKLEYLPLVNSDYNGFVIIRNTYDNGLISLEGNNLYILVVEALHRIFSSNYNSIKINTIKDSILEGIGSGTIELLFSNGQIRKFYMDQNITYEDKQTTIYPQSLPNCKIIKVIARLYDIAGNSFETPIYLHAYNFSIIYNTFSYVYFKHGDRNEGLYVDQRVRSLLDIKKKDIYMSLSNTISFQNIKENNIISNIKSINTSLNNKNIKKSLSTNTEENIDIKSELIKIIKKIFVRHEIISVNNINKGRIYGQFTIINQNQTFEFHSFKGKRVYVAKITMKSKNISEKEFYFTENGKLICIPYEICKFLPDNADNYNKIDINFCFELEEDLKNYIKCNRLYAKELNDNKKNDHLRVINMIETIFDKHIKIKSFSNILECKLKADYTLIKDFSNSNNDTSDEAYKIDLMYIYKYEEMIMTIFLEKKNLFLINPKPDQNIKFVYAISNDLYKIKYWSLLKINSIINMIINPIENKIEVINKIEEEPEVINKIEEEPEVNKKIELEREIKNKIEIENNNILNRNDVERVKFIDLDENTNENSLIERKDEILGIFKNTVSEEINEIRKFEIIDNVTGKFNVMRRDGLIEENQIKSKQLVNATISASCNENLNMLFVKEGMNPVVEVLESETPNLHLEPDTTKMLKEASNKLSDKLQFKDCLFGKEEMIIKTYKNVAIIVDNSDSMKKYNQPIKNEISNKFGEPKYYDEIDGCAFYENSILDNNLKKMIGLSSPGDAIFFISDFQDTQNTNAKKEADIILKKLKEKSISLYLHSVDQKVYDDLSEVANSSGGWSVIYKDFI